MRSNPSLAIVPAQEQKAEKAAGKKAEKLQREEIEVRMMATGLVMQLAIVSPADRAKALRVLESAHELVTDYIFKF